MGSIAGFAPIPFGAAYNMSKAALMALSNTLRVEMAPFNVKVIHVRAALMCSLFESGIVQCYMFRRLWEGSRRRL